MTIREAATVMLVRDAPDFHVFMVRRNPRAAFVGGAYVFPGGALDPGDRAPEMTTRCRGRTDAEASARLGAPAGGLGYWVGAIREAFEEAGVLLARSAAGEPLEVAGPAAERFGGARRALARGERSFLDVVESEDLVLDVGALEYVSHRITPPGQARRFDTRFFAAAAPEGHAYLHDDAETVASMWVRPADALERCKRGELEMIFPTISSLRDLAQFDTAAAFLDAVAKRAEVA